MDGNEYTCFSSTSSSSYPNTSNKMVYYDSKNPSKCAITDSLSLLWLVFLFFPGIAIFNFIKIHKWIKVVEELNKHGKLIKNMPYTLVDCHMGTYNKLIMRPVVDYVLPSGVTVQLKGDPRYDYKNADADGFVDLVIDEANSNNYFIDFEINRLSGNLDSDYYVVINNNNVL